MAENDTGVEARKATPSGVESDWFLRTLTTLAETSQLSFGITLSVGGVLVSGSVISSKTYFDKFGSTFAGALATAGDDFVEKIKSSLSGLSARADGVPIYIHLADARFFGPGTTQPIPEEGSLWRGRLSEVDGFFLGSLNLNVRSGF